MDNDSSTINHAAAPSQPSQPGTATLADATTSDKPVTAWRKFAKEWVLPLTIVAAIVAPFRSAIADWNDVPTGSMEPTILPGDRLFVNKLAFGLRVPFTKRWVTQWEGPTSGDVVILFSPSDGTRLVKRVIAGPGDTIAMSNNHLVINGRPVAYSADQSGSTDSRTRLLTEALEGHAHAVKETPANTLARRTIDPLLIPQGQYFVMGDNRDNSADSRYFGLVPRANIVGRASTIALSVDPTNSYMPRWDRFLKSLK